jgi:hypothetical protein
MTGPIGATCFSVQRDSRTLLRARSIPVLLARLGILRPCCSWWLFPVARGSSAEWRQGYLAADARVFGRACVLATIKERPRHD